MNELISVIVPVYNVENYLKKCVDSIINQTYKPIEIILVDDGSTDSSPDICDYYQNNFTNIKVVHKENEGLSVARNVGLNKAEGEWIAFIDSDDWLEASFCEELHAAAVSHGSKICMCKTQFVNEAGERIKSTPDSSDIVELNYDEIIEGLISQKQVRFEVWNKLWKKDLIEDIRFIKGQISEDVHFDRISFARADKFVFVDKTLHNYLVKRPGNTNSKYRKNRDCVFEEFDAWSLELLSDNRIESATIIKYIAMRFAVIMYSEAFFHHEDKSELKRLKKIFDVYYKNCEYEKNKSVKLFYRLPNLYCKLLKIKRTGRLKNTGM